MLSKSPKDLLSTDITIPSELPEPIDASCYLWTAPPHWLEPSLWSFEEFLNERLHRWVSANPEEREEDRDLEREAITSQVPDGNGRFSPSVSVEDMATLIEDYDQLSSIPAAAATFPKFGNGMLKYFNFDSGHTNLNNG